MNPSYTVPSSSSGKQNATGVDGVKLEDTFNSIQYSPVQPNLLNKLSSEPSLNLIPGGMMFDGIRDLAPDSFRMTGINSLRDKSITGAVSSRQTEVTPGAFCPIITHPLVVKPQQNEPAPVTRTEQGLQQGTTAVLNRSSENSKGEKKNAQPYNFMNEVNSPEIGPIISAGRSASNTRKPSFGEAPLQPMQQLNPAIRYAVPEPTPINYEQKTNPYQITNNTKPDNFSRDGNKDNPKEQTVPLVPSYTNYSQPPPQRPEGKVDLVIPITVNPPVGNQTSFQTVGYRIETVPNSHPSFSNHNGEQELDSDTNPFFNDKDSPDSLYQKPVKISPPPLKLPGVKPKVHLYTPVFGDGKTTVLPPPSAPIGEFISQPQTLGKKQLASVQVQTSAGPATVAATTDAAVLQVAVETKRSDDVTSKNPSLVQQPLPLSVQIAGAAVDPELMKQYRHNHAELGKQIEDINEKKRLETTKEDLVDAEKHEIMKIKALCKESVSRLSDERQRRKKAEHDVERIRKERDLLKSQLLAMKEEQLQNQAKPVQPPTNISNTKTEHQKLPPKSQSKSTIKPDLSTSEPFDVQPQPPTKLHTQKAKELPPPKAAIMESTEFVAVPSKPQIPSIAQSTIHHKHSNSASNPYLASNISKLHHFANYEDSNIASSKNPTKFANNETTPAKPNPAAGKNPYEESSLSNKNPYFQESATPHNNNNNATKKANDSHHLFGAYGNNKNTIPEGFDDSEEPIIDPAYEENGKQKFGDNSPQNEYGNDQDKNPYENSYYAKDEIGTKFTITPANAFNLIPKKKVDQDESVVMPGKIQHGSAFFALELQKEKNDNAKLREELEALKKKMSQVEKESEKLRQSSNFMEEGENTRKDSSKTMEIQVGQATHTMDPFKFNFGYTPSPIGEKESKQDKHSLDVDLNFKPIQHGSSHSKSKDYPESKFPDLKHAWTLNEELSLKRDFSREALTITKLPEKSLPGSTKSKSRIKEDFEADRLAYELKRKEDEAADLKTKISLISSQLSRLEEENASLHNQTEDQGRDLSKLAIRLRELEQEKERLNAKVTIFSDERDRLIRECARAKEERDYYKQRIEHLVENRDSRSSELSNRLQAIRRFVGEGQNYLGEMVNAENFGAEASQPNQPWVYQTPDDQNPDQGEEEQIYDEDGMEEYGHEEFVGDEEQEPMEYVEGEQLDYEGEEEAFDQGAGYDQQEEGDHEDHQGQANVDEPRHGSDNYYIYKREEPTIKVTQN